MSSKPNISIRTFKLYPNKGQIKKLTQWLEICCWIYNHALAQRDKGYKRRKKSVSFYDQCKWLTGLRENNKEVKDLPRQFAISALRRVDQAMKKFFANCKDKAKKKGFPRYKSRKNYSSFDSVQIYPYSREKKILIPKLGEIRAKGQFPKGPSIQRTLRILRRSSGWYVQLVGEFEENPTPPLTGNVCGIDLGLIHFATLDDGSKIKNPRLLKKSLRKINKVQRKLSRCAKGSNRRTKVKLNLAKLHERVKRQRRGFVHRISRKLINNYDRIAVEKLNVKGMIKGQLARSISDVGWGLFLQLLREKAIKCCRVLVEVNPTGTSQTCPSCGAIKKKTLSERIHRCPCGLIIDRDQAAAMVIRNRAFRPGCVEGAASGLVSEKPKQASRMKREGLGSNRS